MNLTIGISAIDHTGKIEELGTLVKLTPKAMLEALFGHFQGALFLEKIEMRQDTEYIARHTTGGQSVQKLHGLHLKAIVAVDHQQHNIRDLRHINHGCERVRGTFKEGETLLLGCHDGQWTLWRAERLLRIPADQ